jgi:hypothetical protein
MVDVLKTRFGVEFQLWDTGGGCTALVGEFEGDVTVYITDAPGSINGYECTITSQRIRVALGESTVGFAIGVYRDEHRRNVTYCEYLNATTAELADLVTEQLKEACRA